MMIDSVNNAHAANSASCAELGGFDRKKYRANRGNTRGVGDMRCCAVHAGARARAGRLYR